MCVCVCVCMCACVCVCVCVCAGLEMAWVDRPPETVKVGEVFNVSYSVTTQDSFYQWALDNSIFTHRCVWCVWCVSV